MEGAMHVLGIETAGRLSASPEPPARTPHPIGLPQSAAMRRFVLEQCQDEEEAADMRAERDATGDAPPAPRHGRPVNGATGADQTSLAGGGVEPAFNFVDARPADELKDMDDPFVSQFMMDVTSSWPQPSTSRLRKSQNSRGKESVGARRGATRGTNATMKTWSSRIRTALAFANFVGRVVCIDPSKPRPNDATIDRGVRKFFRCLAPRTKVVITTFLECRRRGYAVAGGGRRLSATSVKDYSSGLTFLFSEAKIDGVRGVAPVVPDCCERSSPWQPKGVAEQREEEKQRADPGTYTGNPMATADIRDFRGATNKTARHDGETQLSSAPVTEVMMDRFFGELVLSHQPATDASGARLSLGEALSAMVSAAMRGANLRSTAEVEHVQPSGDAAAPSSQANELSSSDEGDTHFFTPPSNALADFLVYVFYVFAFITVARPVTLMHMKFKDISWPDMNVADNQAFFNRCVSCSFFLVDFVCPTWPPCTHRFLFLVIVSPKRLDGLLTASSSS